MEEVKKRFVRIEITTEPVIVEIISEPYVVLTFKGYAPVVDVLVREENAPRVLFIGSSSLSHGIEEIRQRNNGKFKGINLRVRKESTDKFAKYIVEAIAKDAIIGEDLEEK